MRVDKNSLGTLVVVFGVGSLIAIAATLFVANLALKWALIALVLVFCAWQLFFFRVPIRKRVGSDTIVSSSADGKVVICDVAYEDEFLHCDCKRVCVYMNFFDVHANFWPVSGRVTKSKYHPGKHILAFRPKASKDNEHFTTLIRTPNSKQVLMRQIAGTFAQRIVCYSSPNYPAVAGRQCGIIKFGSRLDLYLPLDADIKVKVGDKVRACESVIAHI